MFHRKLDNTFVKVLKYALYKAFIVTILFALLYDYENKELVRSNFDDKGFDLVNKCFSIHTDSIKSAPNILLFTFDNKYMKTNHLFDEDNNTNYGYNFPRSHIIKFINRLDKKVCVDLKNQGKKPPFSLFIDLDLSFPSTDDKRLIDVLARDTRDYIIVLPKTRTTNFIEDSNDSRIQSLIKKKKIIFASTGFSIVSEDKITRRYDAYKSYSSEDTLTKIFYPNVSVVLWKNFQGKVVNNEEINATLLNDNVVNNRILIKDYKSGAESYQSNWKNYQKHSVSYHLKGSVSADYSNSIIMLGSSYDGNGDNFNVLNIFGNSMNMQGVELHANTLMTLFYFDGQLKKLTFTKTLFLAFFFIFLFDLAVSYGESRLGIKETKLVYTIELIFLLFALFYLAYMLMKNGYWFSWFILEIFFFIIDVFIP